MPNAGVRVVGWCRLAALFLLVGIGLSPLCAIAATTPVPFAYDTAARSTPTTALGRHDALRAETAPARTTAYGDAGRDTVARRPQNARRLGSRDHAFRRTLGLGRGVAYLPDGAHILSGSRDRTPSKRRDNPLLPLKYFLRRKAVAPLAHRASPKPVDPGSPQHSLSR